MLYLQEIQIMAKTCPDCDGIVWDWGVRGNTICGHCGGDGYEPLDFIDGVIDRYVISAEREECSVCHGQKQCQTCGGKGERPDEDNETDSHTYTEPINDCRDSIEKEEDEISEIDEYDSIYDESSEYESYPSSPNSSKTSPEFPLVAILMILGLVIVYVVYYEYYIEDPARSEFASRRRAAQQEIAERSKNNESINRYKNNTELSPVSSNDDTTQYKYATSDHDTSIGKGTVILIFDEQQRTGAIIANYPVGNIMLYESGKYLANFDGNITIDSNIEITFLPYSKIVGNITINKGSSVTNQGEITGTIKTINSRFVNNHVFRGTQTIIE